MFEASRNPRERNPRERANIFSRLTFLFTREMFTKANERELEEDDVYTIVNNCRSDVTGDILEKEWQNELKKENASLTRTLVRIFGWEYTFYGLLNFLIKTPLLAITPYATGILVSYFETSSATTQENAIYCGCILIASGVLKALYTNYYDFALQRLGLRIEVSVCALVYRKALKLSDKSLCEISPGRLMTLIARDALIVSSSSLLFLHDLWIGVVQVIIVMGIMYHRVGASTMVGIGFFMASIPIQMWIGVKIKQFWLRTLDLTDERVRRIQEILTSIRLIKLYCWETYFNKIVHTLRIKEMLQHRNALFLQAIILSISSLSYRVSYFLCVFAYYMLGNNISAEELFFLVTSYKSLDSLLSNTIPSSIQRLAEGKSAAERFQTFYTMGEREPQDYKRSENNGGRIKLQGVSVEIADKFVLKRVSVELAQPSLIGITGEVGTGKSTLLKTLMKDVNACEGTFSISGGVSYASQEPWLFPGTIRQNILFGNLLEPARYQEVLKVCALVKDLDDFPERDSTLVIDKGLNLSKGQQARVNLARAVYRKADVYLLDDVLSSLDLNVGRYVFVNCIQGFLRDKLCLFVCHHEDFLVRTDKVTILKDANIQVTREKTKDGVTRDKAEDGVPHDKAEDGVTREKHSEDGERIQINKKLQEKDAGIQITDNQGRVDYQIEDNSIYQENAHANLHREEEASLLVSDNRGRVDHRNGEMSDSKVGVNYREEGGVNFDQKTKEGKEEGASLLVSNNRGRMDLQKEEMSGSKVGVNHREGDGVNFDQKKKEETEEEASLLVSNKQGRVDHRKEEMSDNKVGVNHREEGGVDFVQEKNSAVREDKKLYREHKVAGKVRREVYFEYFRFAGGWRIICPVLLICLVTQSIGVIFDYYANKWLDVEAKTIETLYNNNATDIGPTLDATRDLELERKRVISLYAGILAVFACFVIVEYFSFFAMAVHGAINLHMAVFERVMGATMRFFDTHFSGSVVNRFSRDMAGICGSGYLDIVRTSLELIVVVSLLIYLSPVLCIPASLFFLVLLYSAKRFLQPSRSLRRMECLVRAPCVGFLNASLEGLTTINAFGNQEILKAQFDRHQNHYSGVVFMIFTAKSAFGLWLSMLGDLFSACIIFSFIVFNDKLENIAGNVGVAVTQAIGISSLLQFCVIQWAEMEASMTAVERVLEYNEAEQEETSGESPQDWPKIPKIEYRNVTMKYTNSDLNILRGVTFTIEPRQKIGIVGRTGAGKSSIISALFRLYQSEGPILIDDTDASKIKLSTLRSKISIIPQDPIMFKGTVRSNLDPNETSTDFELWNALEKVGLKNAVQKLGLNNRVEEGGLNWSIGEKQLFCIARVVLAKNKIVVLDEATANMDPETDAFIREMIDVLFADCTVIAIAHRINTVVGCDKIMVVQGGEIVEFGGTEELVKRTSGYFNSLMKL